MSSEGRLRKVGGSVMLAIPPAMLDDLGLGADTPVNLDVRGGQLVVEPKKRRRYSLDELLAQCKPSGRQKKDRNWVFERKSGRELI